VSAVSEKIDVAGGAPVQLEVRESPWGPVGTNRFGRRVAYAWAMSHPEAVNVRSLGFELLDSARELLETAHESGLPWLNVMAADRDGNFGWTLGGRFPKREGYDGRTPISFADGTRRWDGFVGPSDIPVVYNPPSGAVWSANARQLGSPQYLRMMGGDYTDQGARAGQIRDQLLTLTNARPADLLAVQLDDRAILLERWQRILLATLESAAAQPRFAEARPLVAHWGGRASIDSAGYRLVRAFRGQVIAHLLEPALARAKAVQPKIDYLPGFHEGVAWDLLEARPMHLLSARYGSYDVLLVDAARKAIEMVPAGRPIAEFTWGEANRVKVQHPLGEAVPALSRWLDLPERPLPGDHDMPRVQGPAFGASERFVVEPGREAEGIFHMPGGQSGHFLSPYYTAGHQDWEEGRATPLLPGPAAHHLILQ
jgi:penicillin G amidase